MGNTQAATKENRMAIAAMANVMKITRKDILNLRDKCLTIARKGKGDHPNVSTVARSDFLVSMAEIGIAHTDLSSAQGSNDHEVIDRLFTMFDNTGDDRIDHMAFLAGISPLSSLSGVGNKLLFACQVYDVENKGKLSVHDVIAVLTSINDCASYFGDAVLSSDEIKGIIHDLVQSNNLKDEIDYSKGRYIEQIANHSFSKQFLAGQGTTRYGTK